MTSAEDEAAERAYAVLQEGGTAALRLLLHPYLRWTRTDGTTASGRDRVLALLDADPPSEAPRVLELRDGQIYRWVSPG